MSFAGGAVPPDSLRTGRGSAAQDAQINTMTHRTTPNRLPSPAERRGERGSGSNRTARATLSHPRRGDRGGRARVEVMTSERQAEWPLWLAARACPATGGPPQGLLTQNVGPRPFLHNNTSRVRADRRGGCDVKPSPPPATVAMSLRRSLRASRSLNRSA